MEFEKLVLPATLHETPQSNVHCLTLGPNIGKLHGFSDKLVVEDDVGSHDTPHDVYEITVYHCATGTVNVTQPRQRGAVGRAGVHEAWNNSRPGVR
jgi:hypothetical protein